MKVAEIRDLAVDELRQREKDMDDQLFRLRIQKSMGQLEAAQKLKTLRRDLAKIKTVLREREGRGRNGGEAPAERKPLGGAPGTPAAKKETGS
jgi:large subunit ribosomal protein L29